MNTEILSRVDLTQDGYQKLSGGELVRLVPTPGPPPKALSAKLAKVAAGLPEVPKSGRNTDAGYDYATETDIVLAVRKDLFSAGIMLYPSVQRIDRMDAGQSKSGNTKGLVTLFTRFTFVDGESGESWSCDWVSEAMDTQDKALAKALTNALKYFLRDTFLLATGDLTDEVDDSGKPTGRRVSKKTARAPRQSAPPPSQRPRTDNDELRAAWRQLAASLAAAGCDTVKNDDPQYSSFMSWLRGTGETALGEAIPSLAGLSPSMVLKLGAGVTGLILSGAVNPWKKGA